MALVGVVVNIAAAWVLAKANRSSLNVQGAYQHILTDLYGFIGTVIAGIVTFAWPAVSLTLLIVGLGSMLAAAIVLVTHDRSKLRAALVQGTLPLLGLLALLVRLVTG